MSDLRTCAILSMLAAVAAARQINPLHSAAACVLFALGGAIISQCRVMGQGQGHANRWFVGADLGLGAGSGFIVYAWAPDLWDGVDTPEKLWAVSFMVGVTGSWGFRQLARRIAPGVYGDEPESKK